MVNPKSFSVGLGLCLLANVTLAEFTGKDLEKYLSESEKEKRSAAERLKLLEADTSTINVIDDKDLYYRLPNGNYVRGLLLPNGKKAPAIEEEGYIYPACVTKQFQLIKGSWSDKKEKIHCEIQDSELAVIDVQSGTTEAPPKKVANKYQSKVFSEDTSDSPTNSDHQSQAAADSEETSSRKMNMPHDSIEDSSGNVGRIQASKYGGNSGSENRTYARSNRSGTNSGDYYVPPPSNDSRRSKSVGGVIKYGEGKYGIAKGTWIKGKIKRVINSSESGDLEIEITEDVEGRYKTLPAGTVLFAKKGFNSGSRRLEAQTTMAVLPNGNELSNVEALLFDKSKKSGLTGSISRDRTSEAKVAGIKGILNAALQAVPAGETVGTSIASEVTEEMLKNEEAVIQTSSSQVITVQPQNVLLKAAVSF